MSDIKVIQCRDKAVYISVPTLGSDSPLNDYEEFILEQQNQITKLEKAFKFAYENGTFYPAAFNVLDPVYDEFIKDNEALAELNPQQEE